MNKNEQLRLQHLQFDILSTCLTSISEVIDKTEEILP